MVKVVRENSASAAAQEPFEFKVYRMERGGTVFGFLVPYTVIKDWTATWIKTDFGVPVEQATNGL